MREVVVELEVKEKDRFEALCTEEYNIESDFRHFILPVTTTFYLLWQLVNGLLICTEKVKTTFWFADGIFSAILPMIIILLTLKKYKWREIGFIGPGKGERTDFIGYSAGVALLLPLVLNILSGLVAFGNPYGDKYTQSIQCAMNWVIPKPVLILYLSVTAGFFEEIIYKGIITRLVISYVTLSFKVLSFSISLIFSVMHWEQGIAGMVVAFSFSLISFTLYRRYNNLLPVILGHVLYDLLFFLQI